MYLLDEYYNPNGGTEGHIMQLVNYLDSKEFSIEVTVLRETEYINNHNLPVKVNVLNVKKILSVDAVKKLRRFAKYLKANEFKLVHIFFNDASIIAPLFIKLFGIKVIISRRDMGFWYTKLNLVLLKFNQYFVDLVVVNSKAVGRITRQREKIHSEKLKIIYNGYDSSRFKKYTKPVLRADLKLSPEIPIVGIVANIRPIKRINDLINAFTKVHQHLSNAQLVIIGDNDPSYDLSGVLQQAEVSKIKDNIHFLGKKTEVIPYILDFNVCVLCSESEGFSNSIVEYMKCGKATICTDVGGNSEIVEHGNNGYLVNVGDINALARCIETLLINQELAIHMGEKAKLFVSANYSQKRMLEQYTNLYNEILDESKTHFFNV